MAVEGGSMLPALRPGDWLLVDPHGFDQGRPAAGDLVVVPDPRLTERWLVKRVWAVDPDGRLDVRGDSPAASTDSRTFGAVDPATIVGRPWLRYWPIRRGGRVG
ncbi:MAG: nickel-type superoxide dismutase maturation protease [Chloroflexi bacterium]|nr:nickel-type superoxide dismutase maturation protease [Chloroflexota bacterium]